MNFKRSLAIAGAAMALCGLAASSASAEPMPSWITEPMTLGTCAVTVAEISAAEAEKNPQEMKEFWDEARATKCVSMIVSDQQSWDQYVVFEECIGANSADLPSWTKADLDRCLAIATNGNPTGQARKHHQRKHHRKHHRVRHGHGRIAHI
jgi:hypothetical protein